jgi:octaprenyl-diphosphate synthase
MSCDSDTLHQPPSLKEESSVSDRFRSALNCIPELTAVEEIIRASFRSDVAPMRDIPEYLLSLGGKRIRPALTLLTSKAISDTEVSSETLFIAAGIELIHMATLMHDDIIDQSPIRRHKPSPYAKFGTPLTLLSGDFLLTRAFGLCAKLDDTVIAATEQACIELVEGEALETALNNHHHTLQSSLNIAQRKTASLFRLAAFCAGHLNGLNQDVLQLLSEFGERLGIAFQIIDDILDVTATEATLGKRPGLDIIERKPSIVNVIWLNSGAELAKRLLTPPDTTDDSEAKFADEALAVLKGSVYIGEAKALARRYGEDAALALKEALKLLPQKKGTPDAVAGLLAVIDFALERVR